MRRTGRRMATAIRLRKPFMNESYLSNVIEAALLAAGKPLPLAELAQLFDEGARPTRRAIARARSSSSRPSTRAAASS